MRKPRLLAKDVSQVARNQAEAILIQRLVVGILTRGFWGRLKWLVLGR